MDETNKNLYPTPGGNYSISDVELNPDLKKKATSNIGSSVTDFIQTLVVFGAIFATIYLFLAQPHKVSGISMVPSLSHGDYILTDKVSYRLGNPKKGDIIVFKNPRNDSQDFVKRIIATPGDTIEITNGVVIINDVSVDEDSLPEGTYTHVNSFLGEGQKIKIGNQQYFVMGDNRNHSSDSREWGPIIKGEIIGKAFFRYWPPPSFGLIGP